MLKLVVIGEVTDSSILYKYPYLKESDLFLYPSERTITGFFTMQQSQVEVTVSNYTYETVTLDTPWYRRTKTVEERKCNYYKVTLDLARIDDTIYVTKIDYDEE